MNDTTTISVPARDLLRMLKVVHVHAGGDDNDLPGLNTVKFEVRGAVLWLAATDRFTIGVARLRIPGAKAAPVPDADALITASSAGSMIQNLVERFIETATIRFHARKITITDGDGGVLGNWATVDRRFPAWRPMLAGLLAAEPADLGTRFAFDANHLAKFTACGSGEGDDKELPMLFRIVGLDADSRTVLVTGGDWFLGAAMPVMLGENAKALLAADNWADWTTALVPEPKPAEAVSA